MVAMRRLCAVAAMVCTATAAHAVHNYTAGVDTDFVLDRGDIYLYPDFLTPDETTRMVGILDHWSTQFGVQKNPDDMKGAPGLVHEFFFPSYRPIMSPSEKIFVEGIRTRIVEAANNISIKPRAFKYKKKLGVFNHLTAFYKYHPGGTHKLHSDTDKPGRVLTATMTLNEYGKDYEGGRLHVYDGYPKTKSEIEAYQEKYFRSGDKPAKINEFSGKAGTLALFLSENLHEVTPLTWGERYVMLNWMTCYPEEEHAYDDKDLNKEIRLGLRKRKNSEKSSRRKKRRQKRDRGMGRRTDL
mmetsp:Transcript_22744/g.68514  ORF Transcript_22744/g.68514 Transcript_22744/m.68514 type:complete len:298 (-) Transcript_22744:153-1046(-)